MKYINSPINEIKFNNKRFFIKRDDLLSDEFSGNKARKFYYFLQKDYKDIKKLISYGSAQANSMYSMSVLAKLRGWKFDFYVNHIASYLKDNPQGNYKAALENNANIIEKDEDNIDKYIRNNCLDEQTLFIEEGGRVQEASFGIEILANEIKVWVEENRIKDPKIVLPSGTGTTALFLQKYLPFEVLTCACVGGDEYLKKQFFYLESDEKFHPTILKAKKKYHFGKLYKEFYELWSDLKSQTNIEFDLLYDPLGFLTFLESDYYSHNNIIYIHQGGILGNKSMINRYKRKFNISN